MYTRSGYSTSKIWRVLLLLFQMYSSSLTSNHPTIHPFSSCLSKSGCTSRASSAALKVFSFIILSSCSLGVTRHSQASWEMYFSPSRGLALQSADSLLQNIFKTRHLRGASFQGARASRVAPHIVVQQQLGSKVLPRCSFLTMSTSHTHLFQISAPLAATAGLRLLSTQLLTETMYPNFSISTLLKMGELNFRLEPRVSWVGKLSASGLYCIVPHSPVSKTEAFSRTFVEFLYTLVYSYLCFKMLLYFCFYTPTQVKSRVLI